MPTSVRGAADSYQPPVRPARAGTPASKPSVVLQKAGYSGDVQDFNHRVESFVTAHKNATGLPPDPALILAATRSHVQPDQYESLFAVKSAQHAQSLRAINKHVNDNPFDTFVPRTDGMIEPFTPIHALVYGQGRLNTVATARASHPWVTTGSLPIPDNDGFLAALTKLEEPKYGGVTHGPSKELLIGGKTLEQYRTELEQSQLAGAPTAATTMGGGSQANQQLQQARTYGTLSSAVSTVKMGQQKLIDTGMPQFAGLTADGNLNSDWGRAIQKASKTSQWYDLNTKQMAKDAGFGDNTAKFAEAWNRYNELIKKHPADTHILQGLPLATFSDAHGFFGWMVGKGNPVSMGLHTVEHVGELTLGTVGGLVSQSKAMAAALNTMMRDALPVITTQMTFNQAVHHARHVEAQNPTWLRVVYPDLPDNPKGVLGIADQSSNLLLDIVIGNKLVIGGPAIKAGDEAALTANRFQKVSTQLAYNSMKKRGLRGVGEASQAVQGGERLHVAIASAIKKGEISLAEYRQMVADVYHHGYTNVKTDLGGEVTIDTGNAMANIDKEFRSLGLSEEDINAAKEVTTENFNKGHMMEARKLAKELKGSGYPVRIEPRVDVSGKYRDGDVMNLSLNPDKNPVFSVYFGHGHPSEDLPPSFTIWKNKEGQWVVDDVAELEEDAGFQEFANDAEKKAYFDLISKLRGNLTEGDIQLYRNMSPDEMRAWKRGRPIGAGKFFAKEKGAGMGRDVEGIFPSEYDFRVNAADVVETDPGVFRLVRGATFSEGRISSGVVPEVSGQMIHDPVILRSLRTKELPTPNATILQARTALRNHLNDFDKGLRDSGRMGTDNVANMFSSVRSMFARAAPKGEVRRIYDTRSPEDVYNWVVKNLKDRKLADHYRNSFVVARAQDNIGALDKLNETIQEAYAKAYPNVKGKRSPFEPTSGPKLESESVSHFYFPAGREKEIPKLKQEPFGHVLARLERRASRINDSLLSLSRWHRQVIISGAPYAGGESLFYKHAVADTLRRWTGGGGLRFGLDKGQKFTRSELMDYLAKNPEGMRELGSSRAAAEMGEYRYLTEGGLRGKERGFDTKPHFGDRPEMNAAGAWLRHTVSDKALTAYRKSSKEDLGPLVDHVSNSTFYKNKIRSDPQFEQDLQALTDKLDMRVSPPVTAEIKADKIQALKDEHSQQWAQILFEHYRSIEDAGIKAGTPNILDDASRIARENAGAHGDEKLGQWIADNKINLKITDALVRENQFDKTMQWWIGKLLTFNKLNRRAMFDHVFYDTLHELRGAGWEMGDAIPAATDMAKAQTIYHMLDFSNMLQVEQNLRWISYFATKHRLYWTWVARTFARKPVLAAAVEDVKNQLDDKGNFDFTLFGHRLLIPAARLVWANLNDYPETSPPFEYIYNFGKGLSQGQGLQDAALNGMSNAQSGGNFFSRNDQSLTMWGRVALMKAGVIPATYGIAIGGMSPAERRDFDRQMHAHILGYKADHNGQYPSESEAVRGTLLWAAVREMHRANLFVPVLPQGGRPTEIQKLMDEYSNIRDPKKRIAFLEKHPTVVDQFGASNDQAQFLHEQPYWDKYNALRMAHENRLDEIHRMELSGAEADVGIFKQIRAESAAYGKAVTMMMLEESKNWHGNPTYPAGRVDQGEIITPGPWTIKLQGDPFAAKSFFHQVFPNIKQAQLDAHTIGTTIVGLQNEAANIRNKGWQALGYPDEQHAHDRLAQIAQKLEPFRAYPRNVTMILQNRYYQQYVAPYVTERNAKAKLRDLNIGTPSEDVAFAELRAWKEQFDNPVYLKDPETGKMIKFPPPAQIGLQMLPPDEYKTTLAQAAGSNWQNISNYEKNLLGVKTPNIVADGYAEMQRLLLLQKHEQPGTSLQQQQKTRAAQAIDRGVPQFGIKPHPGFYKDYLFSLQPKVFRFERTNIYQGWDPGVRKQFDRILGDLAKAGVKAEATHGTARIGQEWKNYVDKYVVPTLNEPEYVDLKHELSFFKPGFMYTLVSHIGHTSG